MRLYLNPETYFRELWGGRSGAESLDCGLFFSPVFSLARNAWQEKNFVLKRTSFFEVHQLVMVSFF